MTEIAGGIHAAEIRNEINVVNTAMISLGATVDQIAAVVSENFGQMTKKVNLFGTNVAKRLERIAAANQEIAASFREMGTETGVGIGAAAQGAESALDGIGSGIERIGGGLGSFGSGIDAVGGAIGSVGTGAAAFGSGAATAAEGLTALGTALPAVGQGLAGLTAALGGIGEHVVELGLLAAAVAAVVVFAPEIQTAGAALVTLGTGVLAVGQGVTQLGVGLAGTATGAAACAESLPLLGTALLAAAVNVSGIIEYLPELLVLVGTLTAFSLLGEGLTAAGTGLSLIAQGLLAMGEALPAVAAGMAVMIGHLADTTANLTGILTFVLLSAAMVLMALAIQKINESLAPMVASLEKMGSIFSTGFVVGIAVFGAMMALLALTLGKVASGMDKVTAAMDKQIQKLGVLIPLQATSAVLSNPIVGAITVAVAAAAGLTMKALVPQLATGGVAYGPTYAMIGEGKYPEAVIPLGSSPQFASMKNEIASAVLNGLAAMNRSESSGPAEIVLSLDGEKFARAVLPKLERERGRKGIVRLQEYNV